MTNQQMESAVELLKEQVEGLKGRVGMLEIVAKNTVAAAGPEEPLERMVKVIQINVAPKTKMVVEDKRKVLKLVEGGKEYFCITAEEQRIFAENNPGVKTESFKVELQEAAAEKYLNDPENKKQFTKKIEKKVEETVNA